VIRKRYLVCYDIRHEFRLRKVAKMMESYGERIQYSVFISDITEAERRDLQMLLREIVKPEDSIIFIPIGHAYSTEGIEFLGDKPDFPKDGATII